MKKNSCSETKLPFLQLLFSSLWQSYHPYFLEMKFGYFSDIFRNQFEESFQITSEGFSKYLFGDDDIVQLDSAHTTYDFFYSASLQSQYSIIKMLIDSHLSVVYLGRTGLGKTNLLIRFVDQYNSTD